MLTNTRSDILMLFQRNAEFEATHHFLDPYFDLSFEFLDCVLVGLLLTSSGFYSDDPYQLCLDSFKSFPTNALYLSEFYLDFFTKSIKWLHSAHREAEFLL